MIMTTHASCFVGDSLSFFFRRSRRYSHAYRELFSVPDFLVGKKGMYIRQIIYLPAFTLG